MPSQLSPADEQTLSAANNAPLFQLYQQFLTDQDAAGSEAISIEDLRIKWLGKSGLIRQLFKGLRSYSPEEKPEKARLLNLLKDLVEHFFAEQKAVQEQRELEEKLSAEKIDLTLPSENPGVGRVHPIKLVERQILQILQQFGFKLVEGPEIETEFYCFDALNIPAHHPARDMQDTFYTDNGHVLRTHTTSILGRELEKNELPLKSIYSGRVYRNESEDASHQAMFHQFDLVWIGEDACLPQLMGLIEYTFKQIYGNHRSVRFVPKFYPYTEPSIGPQLDCVLCAKKGCPACDYAGWVTVGGAGVLHHKVLEEFGLDPQKTHGVAFGFGTSRLAGQLYRSPNLKTLYDADLRYLRKL